MELNRLTGHEIHDLLTRREVSSREVTVSVFHQIEKMDKKVNAYVTPLKEKALAQAAKADERIRDGKASALTGIPIAIKDNICMEGIGTTCSSHMLENFVPPYQATVVERLMKEGMVFVGKTNMDEFAMGSSTETSYFSATRNPWNLDTIPGGSSGGSSAAVAADETILALGSDTGGSIRQPAALCGVVGMKPTYGRVSRYGLVAFASSLDQIGPITKDVEDAALLMNVISGYDSRDTTSVDMEIPDYTRALKEKISGMRIGIPQEYFVEGIDPGTEEAVRKAAKVLESLGVILEEISLPHTEYAVATYYIIATAEASSNLARYDGVGYGYRAARQGSMIETCERTREEGFGPEVKRRIMLGAYVLSTGYYDAYYLKAQKVRTLVKGDFDQVFKKVDAIIAPTSPTPAFALGEKMDNPLEMYLSDIFTIPTNLAGIPGISIPCGFSDSLPVGMQILGKPFGEETILQIAYAFQQNTDFHLTKPSM